jgi:hypothetical protein
VLAVSTKLPGDLLHRGQLGVQLHTASESAPGALSLMSTRAQAGAQNNQQDESPFRKFIAFAQVRTHSRSSLEIDLSLLLLKQILLVFVVTQLGRLLSITFLFG